jgi:hypothetical protein
MHPIVALHDAYGVIHITQTDNGTYGQDGDIADNGLIIHRIYNIGEYSDIGEYMQRHVWCNEIEWWKEVPEKPNAFAYWDTSLTPHAWNWDSAIILNEVRLERSRKLFECDWTQMPDSPLNATDKALWATYRQELRDITDNLSGDETCVEDAPWPIQP